MKIERWLLALTPAVALATVALGLRLGAPSKARAAIVYATSRSLAAGQRAFSIFAFQEDAGTREPVAGLALRVVARTVEDEATWKGITNDDGVAECVVPVGLPGVVAGLTVVAEATGEILAGGVPADEAPLEAPRPTPPWLPFVRREGDIEIDAVLVGERASPGFPATVWVRAIERASRRPVARASLELEGDESLTPPVSHAVTDARGWTRFVVTPLGLALTITLRARGRLGEGRDGAEATGEWVAPFPMAPGAPRVETQLRWRPGEPIEIFLTEPVAWPTAYLEIDDARGRAWATTVNKTAGVAGGGAIAGVAVPPLPPGIYWAVASAAPFGAVRGATRAAYRAFAVATSDDAALALGTTPEGCTGATAPRDAESALGPCLALSGRAPIERWLALDGFAAPTERDRMARATGLRIALLGLLVAGLLEAVLLVRGAARAQVRVHEDGTGDAVVRGFTASRASTVVVTVLVALLGFVLLAAFLFRVG
jgi:hypothetical protein